MPSRRLPLSGRKPQSRKASGGHHPHAPGFRNRGGKIQTGMGIGIGRAAVRQADDRFYGADQAAGSQPVQNLVGQASWPVLPRSFDDELSNCERQEVYMGWANVPLQ